MKTLKTSRPLLFTLSIVLLVYLCGATLVCLWGTTKSHFELAGKDYTVSHYYLQSTAFLKGQLHLPIKPPKGLLELEDPYDPKANEKYRMHKVHSFSFHDLSLYKNKFYMYFGPTPVITFYLPLHFLLANPVTCDVFAAMFFMYGALIWATLLLTHIRNKYFKNLPYWILLTSISVIGFTNIGLYILRRPAVYEIATACGCFFLTGAVYWLVKAIDKPREKPWMLALGSLFIGLAIGARPNLTLATSSLLLAGLILFKHKLSKKAIINSALALVLPISACIALLMLYNYLRFDDMFQTGYSYQLRGHLPLPLDIVSFFPNLKYYLFSLPKIDSVFPFVHLHLWGFPSYFPQNTQERIGGIIPTNPFVLLLLMGPCMYVTSKINKKNKSPFPKKEFTLILLPCILLMLFLFSYPYVALRYTADFSTLLLLSTSIMWFYSDSQLSTNVKLRNILRRIGIILATVSIIFGLAISIEGPSFGLTAQNSGFNEKIKLLLKRIPKLWCSRGKINPR